MRHTILLVALAISGPAMGQTLTKAEEGRVATAQCFAECSHQAHDSVRWTRFEAEPTKFYSRHRRLRSCIEHQEHLRVMDACRVSCLDIAEAYGVPRSHARWRFERLYDAHRAPLMQAGLWDGFQNSPVPHGDDPETYGELCDGFIAILDVWNDRAAGVMEPPTD